MITNAELSFLAGGGEMAQRMRGFDWGGTPLGHPARWSVALKAMVRMTLAASRPMLVLWGLDQRCFYNDAYRQTLDHERHPALLGQSASPFWRSKRWSKVFPAIARVLKGESASADGLPLEPGLLDGDWTTGRWHYDVCPIHDATSAHGVGGVVVFCTAEPQPAAPADDHLERGRADVDFVLEATAAGLFAFDATSGVVRLSDRALELFGCDVRTPTAVELLERVHPDDREALRSALTGTGRANSFRLTLRLFPVPNDLRYVSVAGRFDPEGSGRATGVFWDVTEHRLLVDSLQIADRRKDEFLATLAHELRNPLAALRSAAYLVTREGVTPERLRWCGEVIQRQSRAMAMLLDDLMEVSRITRGKVELKLEPVELQTIVDAALETARPALEARAHCLEIVLPEVPLKLEADPLRLAQVLTHLLANAARYTEPGGVVRLSAAVEGGELRLAVADNGVGIAPEQMSTLFEMFHRQTAAVRGGGAGGGLGVGLSVSKGLVELHGGRLEAASRGPGHGSTFTVTLPMKAVTAAEVAANAEVVSTAPQVLVADDNADAAEAIATLLRMENYAVEIAHDGMVAFETARVQQPFAAFLDIGMPGLDGYALAAQIRRQPWGEQMYLVAMTGWGQGADRDRATAAGFDMHLTKPVDPDKVTALLAKRLETMRRTG